MGVDVFNSYAPLDETDMEELGCRVKHLNIVERALGYILKTKARKHGLDPNARRRLLKQAMSKFDAALESDPDNKGTLRNYSDVLALLGADARADFYYRRALDVDPRDTTTLFAYAVFLENCCRFAEAEAFFLRCLEIDNFNDHAMQTYGYFVEEKLNDALSAERFYELASRVRRVKLRLVAESGPEVQGELFDTDLGGDSSSNRASNRQKIREEEEEKNKEKEKKRKEKMQTNNTQIEKPKMSNRLIHTSI